MDLDNWEKHYSIGPAAMEALRNLLAQHPAAIPRLANCGKYTATDNTGQHYYLNHANTWQTFQGEHPTAVDGADKDDARRYRALVATGKYVPAMREGWGLACGRTKASKAELDAAADALAQPQGEE